ncbi:MAG TPA: helix-hairpin-helix domain-containing protein [Bacillota bacterium]|nr:helix-hairpin-helix domain-containing protein [Bacillota bacterium]HOL52245.1 helix-hairpin-helix domain-containing protein [Bacillota bacterium]
MSEFCTAAVFSFMMFMSAAFLLPGFREALAATPGAFAAYVYLSLILSGVSAAVWVVRGHIDRIAKAQAVADQEPQLMPSISSSIPDLSQKTTAPLEVRINIASETEIAALPTVGPILAKRIIQERTQRPFSSTDDLVSRCDLKPHQIVRIAPFIKFDAGEASWLCRVGKWFSGNTGSTEIPTHQAPQPTSEQHRGRIVDA